MSWAVDEGSYRGIAVQFQIQDLSKGMHKWADDFKKSLDADEKATIVVRMMFTERPSSKKKRGTGTNCHTYKVASGGKSGNNFERSIKKISTFALGNQKSFGVFVQMEREDSFSWCCSYESFYGSVVQERQGYTREQMLENLGLKEDTCDYLSFPDHPSLLRSVEK